MGDRASVADLIRWSCFDTEGLMRKYLWSEMHEQDGLTAVMRDNW